MTCAQAVLRAVTLAGILCAAGRAHADDRIIQLGGGLAFDVLGNYDLGAELGGAAQRSDLGPGTLGPVLSAGVRVSRDLTVGGEARLAIGGLVRTDERYFDQREVIGSTLMVDAKLYADWTWLRRGFWGAQLGGDLGVERMIESTPSGSVHLEAIVGGPSIGVVLGGHVVVQLRGDVHVPVHGEISGQASGDPRGMFVSGGIRAVYVFGVGPRIPADAASPR